MELVGLLLIAVALLIFAYGSKNNLLKVFYLGVAMLFFIIAGRVMIYSYSYLNSVFFICMWSFILMLFVWFIYTFWNMFEVMLKWVKLNW